MKIEELCSKLQQKRNERGLTIEEAVERTKLYPSVIRDIESFNLANISSAYIKGYIKIYASFLGVEVEDALEDLKSGGIAKNKPVIKNIIKNENKEAVANKPKKEKKVFPPQIKKIILYAIAVFVIAWLSISLVRFVSKSFSNFAKKSAKKQEKPLAKISLPQNKAQSVTVSVSAKRECYMRVKVDGKVFFEGILKKGLSETWKARKEIEFRISDGSSVYLEVNGKSVPALTSAHRPIKSLKITPSGISVIK